MDDLNSLQVCLMGMGIVFLGLVCLIILCFMMSSVLKALKNNSEPAKAASVSAPAAPVAQPAQAEEIPNREELVAAVSAVIAEELGKDVSAIRIVSLKRI